MKIALLQCPPPAADPAAGLARIDGAARDAAARGAALLVTPEMAVTGYAIGADTVRKLAEPATGAYHKAVADMCRKHGLAIAYGYPERGTDDDQGGAIYNSAQLVDASGQARINYRKTHLFGDVDRAQFLPGAALSPVVALGDMRVALAICYDIEFPELVRAHALAGADLVIAPTANMVPFDSVCSRIVPARAEENGIGMVYGNFVGSEGEFTYCGASCIVDAGGRDLARAGATDTALLIGDFVGRHAPEGAHLTDRRPDLYAALTAPNTGGET